MSNYEQSHTERYKGNTSKKSRKNVGYAIGNNIDAQPFRKDEEQRMAERINRYYDENKETEQLLALGKLCAYIEAFDNIPLKEQEIPQIEGIDKPEDTESFKIGYAHAKMLVAQGLPEKAYHEHLAKYSYILENASKGKGRR